MKHFKVQIQKEVADNEKTIFDRVCWIQDVRKHVHWWSMNLFEQTQQKDHCNLVWYDQFVQIRAEISDTALNIIEWVYCDLQCH